MPGDPTPARPNPPKSGQSRPYATNADLAATHHHIGMHTPVTYPPSRTYPYLWRRPYIWCCPTDVGGCATFFDLWRRPASPLGTDLATATPLPPPSVEIPTSLASPAGRAPSLAQHLRCPSRWTASRWSGSRLRPPTSRSIEISAADVVSAAGPQVLHVFLSHGASPTPPWPWLSSHPKSGGGVAHLRQLTRFSPSRSDDAGLPPIQCREVSGLAVLQLARLCSVCCHSELGPFMAFVGFCSYLY